MKQRVEIIKFITIGAFLLLGNCSKTTEVDTFNAKDGSASYIASEVNDMGSSVINPSQQLSKSLVSDSITVNWIKNWGFDPVKKVFFREVNVTYPSGLRNRVDSVWFMGATMQETLTTNSQIPIRPSLDKIGFIHHKRSSSRTWNSLSADVELDINITITKSLSETYMTKTGSITKSRSARNLEQEWDATISGVKRIYKNGSWSLPFEGVVNVERTTVNSRSGKTFNRTINITYQPDSTALVTAKRSYDNSQVNFIVDFKSSQEGNEN